MIKSQINVQPLKYKDTSYTLSVDSTGDAQYVNTPVQGTTSETRTGDQITIEYLEVNFGSFYADNTNQLRVMLLQFHGPQATGFNLGNILANGPSTTPDPLSLYVPYITNETFSVLYDKLFVLNINSSLAQQCVRIKRLVPKIKKMGFTANTNSALQGQIFLVYISDSGVTPHPTLQFTCRTWFRDV
jgi:hypothetical protein